MNAPGVESGSAVSEGSLVPRVLACSIVVMAVALRVRHCLGLFPVPMTAAEVIGRQGFSLGIAPQNLGWGASGPFVGWLADRHSARPVVSECAVLLAIGFAACGVQLIFIGTHLPAYLVECGLTAADGAWALALVGLFNVIGTVGGVGALGFAARPIGAPGAGLRLADGSHRDLRELAAQQPIGRCVRRGHGSVVVGCRARATQFLGARFGAAHLSALFGLMYFSHQIGSFFGPWAGAALRDLTATYRLAWWGCVPIGLLAVSLTPAARAPYPVKA